MCAPERPPRLKPNRASTGGGLRATDWRQLHDRSRVARHAIVAWCAVWLGAGEASLSCLSPCPGGPRLPDRLPGLAPFSGRWRRSRDFGSETFSLPFTDTTHLSNAIVTSSGRGFGEKRAMEQGPRTLSAAQNPHLPAKLRPHSPVIFGLRRWGTGRTSAETMAVARPLVSFACDRCVVGEYWYCPSDRRMQA